MKKTILITGANRGIGLGFVEQYAQQQNHVIACCREPNQAKDLQALKNQYSWIDIYPLDITKQSQIDGLKQNLKNVSIDYLINNAGIYGVKGECLGTITKKNMFDAFLTNTCGTLMLCQSMLELVELSNEKLIVTISSSMGSISGNQYGNAYAYRASKNALNAVMKSLSIDVRSKNIRVLILHPGWVKTELGGPKAEISVQESVSGMCKVIANSAVLESGAFYDYQGNMVNW